MIKTRTGRFEQLSSVACVLEQVKTEFSQADNGHPAAKRWTVTVVGFAHQGCAEYVAVEANTAVEVPNRGAHVMRAGYPRLPEIVSHS
ncbi:MAG: hypothetical protein WBR28_24210 [Mycobacterium sp.]